MSDPIFETPTTNPFGVADVGNYATPTLVDIDGDGNLDALVGNFSGNTLLFRNALRPVRTDLDGDRKSDILWRNDDGRVALWQMNSSTVTTNTVFATVSTDWKISNSGDFNGNSKE